jgi:uncharacterized RDD family membrane protein YckC
MGMAGSEVGQAREPTVARPDQPCHDVVPVTPHAARRVLAGVIDGLVTLGAAAAVAGVLSALDVGASAAFISGAVAGAVYLLVRDGLGVPLMDYRSFGKRLMALRPVESRGICIDLSRSALRNCTLAISPLGWALALFMSLGTAIAFVIASAVTVLAIVEFVMVLAHPQGRRLGDQLAGTTVLPTETPSRA